MTGITGSFSKGELPSQEAYTLPKHIKEELSLSPLANRKQLVEQMRAGAHAESTVRKVLDLPVNPQLSSFFAAIGSKEALLLASSVKDSTEKQTASLSLIFPLAIASSLLEQDIAPNLTGKKKEALGSVITQLQAKEVDLKIIEKLLGKLLT
jgi:hypothetical protein